MAKQARRRRIRRSQDGRRGPNGSAAPIDPPDDTVESGGALYYAVDLTPAGFPIGPRVPIVDGRLRFLDDEILDVERFTEEADS
jgi:hypothetical protein